MSDVAKLAASFERHLGAPHDATNVISFGSSLDHDDRETFSHEGMSHLQAWRLPEHQVPVAFGGRATDLEEWLELLRLLARRDAGLATSIAATAAGFMPVWVAGTHEQKLRYGGELCRGAAFSWALSERGHGSDVMATETRARREDGGYVIDGEKWPIGNSALGDYVTVLARTGDRGPTALSVLIVDRATLPARCVAVLARERLQGIRSIDNGGLRFADCFVPETALVGEEGRGLEIALKASLAARAFAPMIAVGCADTALRLTLDFAVRRVIFGGRVVDVAYTRRRLTECFADLMIADAVAIGGCRALQASPDQSSVTSSIVKFLVPTMLERTVSQLATVLGARHYLRSDPHYGMFHKAMRDLWIAHFAEGNTVVNLKAITMQLPQLLAIALDGGAEQRERAERSIETVYDLDAALPAFEASRTDMRSRRGDDALTALPAALGALRRAAAHEPEGRRQPLLAAADLGERFLDELERIRTHNDDLREAMRGAYGQSAEVHELAERYCAIHAAAAVVHLSVHSAHCLSDPLPDPAVTVVCLARLWQRFHPLDVVAGQESIDRAAEVMLRLHAEGRSFSHRQIALAERLGGGGADLVGATAPVEYGAVAAEVRS